MPSRPKAGQQSIHTPVKTNHPKRRFTPESVFPFTLSSPLQIQKNDPIAEQAQSIPRHQPVAR